MVAEVVQEPLEGSSDGQFVCFSGVVYKARLPRRRPNRQTRIGRLSSHRGQQHLVVASLIQWQCFWRLLLSKATLAVAILDRSFALSSGKGRRFASPTGGIFGFVLYDFPSEKALVVVPRRRSMNDERGHGILLLVVQVDQGCEDSEKREEIDDEVALCFVIRVRDLPTG